MLIHDLIKINLVKNGYLPNYPYHLISDNEMYEGFYLYFADFYPYPKTNTLNDKWNTLFCSIVYHIQKKIKNTEYIIPDWVYSYMIGSVIGPKSNLLDIHDLISMLGVDNIDDEYGAEQETACYEASKRWILQTKQDKEIQIDNTDDKLKDKISEIYKTLSLIPPEFAQNTIKIRPPSIFGEPHVIKYLRLAELPPF